MKVYAARLNIYLLFFSYMLFSIVPVIIDIIVAIVYFILAFNWYFGLIVFATMGLYLGKFFKFSYMASIILSISAIS